MKCLQQPPGARVATIAAVAGVLAQIVHPLVSGPALRAATGASVLLLALAALAHAAAGWGPRASLTLLTTAGGIGLGVEVLGVHTGFPFGSYTYADTLGPRLAAVPVVVPFAWLMVAYPCLLMGRRLARSSTAAGTRVTTALTGGVALAGWDLFLDPQMVFEGHWSWLNPTPALPGVPGVPLTNYAGWLLVSVAMIAALDQVACRGNHRPRRCRPRC